MPRRTDIIAPRCSPPLTSLAQPAAGLRPRTRGVYASPRKSEVTAIDDKGGARCGRVRSRRRADRMGSPPPLPQAVRRRRSGDGAFPDRGDEEVEAGGTKLLRLGTAVGNPALLEGADDLREEMTLLALVEPGLAASAQFRAFEPVEHEQRAFDP